MLRTFVQATVSKKIICPFHQEDTPSCVLYSNGYFCFGCGARGKLEELDGIELPPREELEPEPPEDLVAAFARINSLEQTEVRGLKFPADHRGYYLCWPDQSYYKLRVWEPGSGPKYLGARGHKRGLFWARQEGHQTLVLVEGEINALSIAKAVPGVDVASPGGVGDFTVKKIKHKLTSYCRYSTILVVADADPPGATAIIEALSALWTSKINAKGLPMSPDANEVLVKCGEEELKRRIEAALKKPVD